ncbi:MAG: carboxypeptidase regulatory-like domain-containing protein [Bryobacterales bacterium]|nr:carboxypeptidase regulatory-like domain-containing protein [Bryobacterales bacterium]
MYSASRVLFLTILGVALTAMPAWAQQDSASITGQITDSSGGAIAGAVITVKNQASGAAFSTVSDASGFYRAPQLRPGVYNISVTAKGFSTAVREAIEARVNDRLRVDMPMQVGTVSENVLVTGAPPLLQTEDATIGQVVDNQKIVELPLNGRSWLQLALLSPGAVTYGTYDSYNPQSAVMNLGGNRTSQTDFLIDGADNNSFVVGGGAQAHPPVDSLQEFKVQSNNYGADTGRLGGAVVNATIKSGTNSLHGSLYDFVRNRELNARNYFTAPTASKPQFTRNQFGASLGGPIIRNKLFFFGNYEGHRVRQDSVIARQVFTDAQKAGNFAPQLGNVIGADPTGASVRAGQIFDPYSLQTLPNGSLVRTPFPDNIIPVSRMNPATRDLISKVPGPNVAGSPNFVRNVGSSRNINTTLTKFDWVRSEKDTVSGRIIWGDTTQLAAPALGFPADGVRDGGAGGTSEFGQRTGNITWTHIFKPTDLNDFRVGYLRSTASIINLESAQNLNSQYGITAFPDPGAPAGGLAVLSVAGFSAVGSGGTTSQPFIKYELSDSYTAIRGAHTFKFGFRVGDKRFYNQLVCTNCRGTLSFSGVYTNQPGFGASGNAVADFLLGIGASGQFRNRATAYDFSTDYLAYAQDLWRLSSKLTITLGVQWAYNPANYERYGNSSNVLFDFNSKNVTIVVPKRQSDAVFNAMKNVLFPTIPVRRGDEYADNLLRNTYKNFAPRVGIAYQLTSKTVIRTGYGVFNGFPDVVNFVPSLNPPTRVQYNLIGNNINPTLLVSMPLVPNSPLAQAPVNPVMTARDPNTRPDFTQMYNVNIQQQLPANMVLEVGYMGNRSSRVLMVQPVNDAYPALPNDSSNPQTRRRVTTLLGPINYLTPSGYSNYNAMIVSLEKRFSHGLSVVGSFTWSRALGMAPAITEGINGFSIQDPTNLSREYGPLEYDIVKRFVTSYLYELPFGRGKRFLTSAPRAVDLMLGGWQINGITTMQGGFPLTPTLSYSLGKTDTVSRPNLVGDPTASARQPHNWLNAAAFAIPTNAEIAAGNFYGNQGVNVVRAPGLVNFDFSVFKNIPIREEMKLQFRTEIFNATNTPFFGAPGSVGLTVGTPTFGRVSSAGDPRIIQLALKFVF